MVNDNNPSTFEGRFYNKKALKLKILDLIRNKGMITKQEIAKELGINITTVSELINQFYNKYNVIKETGNGNSSGGRKPKLYSINNELGYIIGIDVGGTNTRGILTDLAGNIIRYIKIKTKASEGKEAVLAKIFSLTSDLISLSDIPKEKFFGIGMSISGIINSFEGISIFCPNIPGWENLPIKKIMEEKFKIPVCIDDSVRCAAVAEKRFGIAKDHDNFIFISIGKGIGMGAFIDGKIYRGSMGLAGELGHITVSEDGPLCNCGNKGCLEAIASGPGILRRAREGIENGIVTSISKEINKNFENLSVEIISKAANEGDKFAYYLINRTGEYIGIAIAAALNLFGCDLVVLWGGILECGDIILDAIKRTVKMRALEFISKRVRIEKTAIGDNIAALGAAQTFIDKLYSDSDYNILVKSQK
ncbi:MAG: ROK family transcriptional regulator [Actinobacteria bacterium]|nr:ROK family transcriptional regulator [Cyanobacteriota bacterium]MCL5771499.1 ROK family transcriptional regulator [Actinomycetota bacterium]